MEPRFVIAQLGARMHYAVARTLANRHLLEHMFTDLYADKGWARILKVLPKSLRRPSIRRVLDRSAPGVPPARVTAFNRFGAEYAVRRARAHTATCKSAVYLWAGREFGRLVVNQCFGGATGVYCFNTAGLEILEMASRLGLRTVIEQTIAPKRLEHGLLAEERDRFPEWDHPQADERLSEFIDREESEWHTANLIVCGSEFVREGIRKCNGPDQKCVVVPYGVEIRAPDRAAQHRNRQGGDALRVLTVGSVSLRKGAPYILEAAKSLKRRCVFLMVGSIDVTPKAQSDLREYVQLAGATPRSEMAEHFQWADVFLLPSICEGSATAIYEALAHSLPVICTPNAGSVVSDGEDGYVIPPHDSCAIVEKLELLHRDRDLLANLSMNARTKAESFTLTEYGRRLSNVLLS